MNSEKLMSKANIFAVFFIFQCFFMSPPIPSTDRHPLKEVSVGGRDGVIYDIKFFLTQVPEEKNCTFGCGRGGRTFRPIRLVMRSLWERGRGCRFFQPTGRNFSSWQNIFIQLGKNILVTGEINFGN